MNNLTERKAEKKRIKIRLLRREAKQLEIKITQTKRIRYLKGRNKYQTELAIKIKELKTLGYKYKKGDVNL